MIVLLYSFSFESHLFLAYLHCRARDIIAMLVLFTTIHTILLLLYLLRLCGRFSFHRACTHLYNVAGLSFIFRTEEKYIERSRVQKERKKTIGMHSLCGTVNSAPMHSASNPYVAVCVHLD